MTRLRSVGLWGVGAAGVVALAATLWCLQPIPPAVLAPPDRLTLALEDRHGRPLRTVRGSGGSLQAWVPLADVDPRLIQAFVALEDRRFYEHHGLDGRAVLRAARDNVRAGRIVSGASTLTMQLARLLVGSDRDWGGKVHQAAWAVRLERSLSKQALLEQYLNRVPLGQGAVGVAAGARLYFDAAPGHLSHGQAALLAGIARSPSRDNPLVSPDRARARRSLALERMVAAGFLTPADARRAALEPVREPGRAPFLAPHFTTRLLQQLDGGPQEEGDRGRGGGPLRTSLDLELQGIAEAEVRHAVDVLRDRNAHHAATVVLDNRTGEILAWVGSPDFWADTMGQVDMVVSPRQPGSTLKPFAYGLAFDRGHSAASVLPDVPRVYQTATGPYRPRNYDRVFHGPVRVREALASSYNVPAVELVERLGAASLLDVLHRAGFTSLDRGAVHYGLGLALGNGDVTLLEIANAYRALAAGGVWRPVRWLATVPVAPKAATGERRVLSAGAAALVLDILADPVARLPGFGAGSALELPFPAATKTGTSRHFTDNWAAVTTDRFTVAAWVGNFSGRAMRGVSGVTGAAPLAYRVALATARRYPPGALPSPAAAGAAPLAVCRLSGLRAGPDCPVTTEWFLPGTAPADACGWHRGGTVTLPLEYAEWVAAVDGRAGVATEHAVAATLGGLGAGRAAPPARLHIVSPRDGDRYSVPPGTDPRYATIALRATGAGPGEAVRWFVDGRPVAGARWTLAPGRHLVRAVTPSGDRAEVGIEVRGSP